MIVDLLILFIVSSGSNPTPVRLASDFVTSLHSSGHPGNRLS